MKGMITGLTLDDSVNDLARKFNVTLEVGPISCFLPYFAAYLVILGEEQLLTPFSSRRSRCRRVISSTR